MKSLEKIRAAISRKGVEALLVTQPENRRYLSGYTATDLSITESSGVLLVPKHRAPLLLTDARFKLQAEQEAVGCEVLLFKKTLLDTLITVLGRLGVRTLAFESHYLLHATAVKLMGLGKEHNVEMIATSGMVEKLRARKTRTEIDKIRRSVLLNEAVFQEVFAALRPGQTERAVALEIESTMMHKGATEKAFPTIVAFGPNAAQPHAVPGDRVLREGEIVLIDMGLKLDGYCSDMTRTVVLGKPDRQTVQAIRLVRKAQRAALKTIKAGVPARDVDRAAREIIRQAGYGKNFSHSLGHGVGLAVHELPYLNRLRRNKLQAGMVVTVEPGIYLPGWGGVRLENMAVVEENGCTILNKDTTFLNI